MAGSEPSSEAPAGHFFLDRNMFRSLYVMARRSHPPQSAICDLGTFLNDFRTRSKFFITRSAVPPHELVPAFGGVLVAPAKRV
jgi:hypothetical protein